MTTSTAIAIPSDRRQSDIQATIQAAYRQVFGNAHIFENERSLTAESLFANGDLAVQGLVNALAHSDAYRRLMFEPNNPYRFIELNFKHLLGRAPRDQAELSEHVQRLASEGFDAEIDSMIYSTEYLSVFGDDTVPYDRGQVSQAGESNLTYNRTRALNVGRAGFDGSQQSVLLYSIATGSAPRAAAKIPGNGERNQKRFVISWTTASPVGINRRANQTTTVPFGSLSEAVRSIGSRGGRIASITKA